MGTTALWPSRPGHAAAAMGFDEARHLLSRTTFGATPAEIHSFAAMDHAAAVDRLLDTWHGDALTMRPAWDDLASGLRNWWVEEMLVTDQPMVERMTLFWHGHFTSAFVKVRSASALYTQNALLRRQAFGNFGQLLKAVARDPAMLVYLDGARSNARQPNENFARELLELFTLGEGHYDEADVKSAARAFAYDGGKKTFLGQTGYFDGDEILEIVLRHPRTAELVCEKLWREFVSLAPDPNEIQRLAAILRDGYELVPVLKAMLLSPAFRDPRNHGTLIKSPVELVVGSVHLLGLAVPEKTSLVRAMGAMGQWLFDPPDVRGWPGGERWITTYTVLLREQVLRSMIGATTVASTDGAMMRERRPVEGRSLRDAGNEAKLGPTLAGVDADELVRVLLPRQPFDPVARGGAPGAVVAAAMLDPVYQLK